MDRMHESPSPLLAIPGLPLPPLYPGGFFPPFGIAAAGGSAELADADAARRAMDWEQARTSASRAEAVAREADDVPATAAARIEHACTDLLAGELERAASYAREVLAESAGLPRLAKFAAALVDAIASGLAGRADEALAKLTDAERHAQAAGDVGLVLIRVNRAAVRASTGVFDEAERDASSAQRAGRRAKDDEAAAIGALSLAIAHLARGRRAAARSRLGDALRTFERTGDVLRQIQCHHLLGEVAWDGEDAIRAGGHYRDGLSLARPANALPIVELLTLRFEHR
ncbi:hypothetical protein [Longimicrobium terrae]|uniref:Tetratricopeptide (TPR) repeat protein n=1 Tax=Longimicrobium terrae TaxID=1639882 RepID=A0A841GY26_9BACT|nr:hypothetical protein [Longimicrobium terrae]MBB4636259.1 tetratricopeptide (TPR) repeat protein [Longimicrobium terrae]MBB6070654.1 tetratricopeptide (TPR) repeat protein [Longimicrobium terrae]NNC29637.1 hypothetical protein [Longimicrobium terrae]